MRRPVMTMDYGSNPRRPDGCTSSTKGMRCLFERGHRDRGQSSHSQRPMTATALQCRCRTLVDVIEALTTPGRARYETGSSRNSRDGRRKEDMQSSSLDLSRLFTSRSLSCFPATIVGADQIRLYPGKLLFNSLARQGLAHVVAGITGIARRIVGFSTGWGL